MDPLTGLALRYQGLVLLEAFGAVDPVPLQHDIEGIEEGVVANLSGLSALWGLTPVKLIERPQS